MHVVLNHSNCGDLSHKNRKRIRVCFRKLFCVTVSLRVCVSVLHPNPFSFLLLSREHFNQVPDRPPCRREPCFVLGWLWSRRTTCECPPPPRWWLCQNRGRAEKGHPGRRGSGQPLWYKPHGAPKKATDGKKTTPGIIPGSKHKPNNKWSLVTWAWKIPCALMLLWGAVQAGSFQGTGKDQESQGKCIRFPDRAHAPLGGMDGNPRTWNNQGVWHCPFSSEQQGHGMENSLSLVHTGHGRTGVCFRRRGTPQSTVLWISSCHHLFLWRVFAFQILLKAHVAISI